MPVYRQITTPGPNSMFNKKTFAFTSAGCRVTVTSFLGVTSLLIPFSRISRLEVRQYNGGAVAQTAFARCTAVEREFIISGLTAAQQKAVFDVPQYQPR
jgi:hypothetical protein